MANLKSITELPVAESAEGLNLIVNDNGSAKQIAASAVGAQADWTETDENSPAYVKNKPAPETKELIYEWNFSTEDEVFEVMENVDDDLSWLTTPQENVSFEIVVENYGCYRTYVEGEGDQYEYLENAFSRVSSLEIPCYNQFTNMPEGEGSSFIYKEMLRGGLWGFEWQKDIDDNVNFWCCAANYFDVINGTHLNDEGPITVENGGFIVIGSDTDSPLKSIKIYKITR